MRIKLEEFLRTYPEFDDLGGTEQITRLIYFYTILERHGTTSQSELENVFHDGNLALPKNLSKLLAYLCGKGKKLINRNGEYSLQRKALNALEIEFCRLTESSAPPKIAGVTAFDFSGKVFADPKVKALLEEIKRCYTQQCWNAAGILIRIIVERTLDASDPKVKAKTGLRDKINYCVGCSDLFSKTIRDGMKELHGTKIIGDVAAHHSSIILEKNDIDLVLPVFRMVLKEVKNI